MDDTLKPRLTFFFDCFYESLLSLGADSGKEDEIFCSESESLYPLLLA